jgi:hypothetical protein
VSMHKAKWSLILVGVFELDRVMHLLFDALDSSVAIKVHIDIGESGMSWLRFAELDEGEFHQMVAWEFSFLHEEVSATPVDGFPQDVSEPGMFWFDLWWVGDEDE